MKYDKYFIIILVITFCFITQKSYSRTWHIHSDGSGDAPNIPAAMDSATTGDTILVAPGSYVTGADQGLSMNKSIYLLSEAGPQNTLLHPIHLSEGSSVVCITNLSSNSELRGFTIFGGHPWMGLAGGIYIENSSTLIQDNIIRNNSSQNAGAIYCNGSGGTPIIRKNIIYSNEGLEAAAAIYIRNVCAIIDSNTIAYNTYYEDIAPTGAILIESDHSVFLANNIIAFNEGIGSGGESAGIYCVLSSSSVMIHCNCVFGNTPLDYGGFCTDQTGLNGNISIDPQFCAVKPDSSGNFYIQSDSPCAIGNHPYGHLCGLIGQRPIGCGATHVDKGSWSKIKSLYQK